MGAQPGRCSCGAPYTPPDRFCARCGRSLAPAVPPPPPPWAPVAPPAPPARARRPRLHPALVIVPLLVFTLVAAGGLALALPSGRWDLLPAMVTSVLHHGWSGRLNPAPPARSKAPAVDLRPLPGLRLTAPAGALDKSRKFAVKEISKSDLARLQRDSGVGAGYLLGGFSLEAGMGPREVFPGEMTVTLDLKQRQIPAELWPYMHLGRVDETGAFHALTTEHQGSQIRCRLRHNAVDIPFWVASAFIGYGVLVYIEKEKIPSGQYRTFYWKPKAPRFRVYVEESKSAYTLPANPREAKKVNDALGALFKRYFSGNSEDYQTDMIAMRADPEYKKLEVLLNDEKWLRENYLPRTVTYALEALDRGYDYLTKERGFRPPGGGSEGRVIDVYFAMGLENAGEARNPLSTSPFMVFDLARLPRVPFDQLTGDSKRTYDALQMVAMHELFHVDQSNYVWYDADQDTWLREATAVLLEEEAEAYYRQHKFVEAWETTITELEGDVEKPWLAQWSFFKCLDYFNADDNSGTRRHGYGAAVLLRFIRDNYFASGGQAQAAYLPMLMENYAKWNGDCLSGLYNTTNAGRPDALANQYLTYCFTHADQLMAARDRLPANSPSRVDRVLGGSGPDLVPWTLTQGPRPLSAEMAKVRLEGPARSQDSPDKGAAPVFGVSTDRLDDWAKGQVIIHVKQANGKWEPVRDGLMALPPQAEVRLMRVETYVRMPEGITAGAARTGPILFTLTQPPTPSHRLQGKNLVIEWDASNCARVASLASSATPLVKTGYIVTLTPPAGPALRLRCRERRLEIPLEELRRLAGRLADQGVGGRRPPPVTTSEDEKTLAEIAKAWQGPASQSYAVCYQEQVVARSGKALVGPVSGTHSFSLEDEKIENQALSGSWIGRIPFTGGEMVRYDIIETGGGNFRGTYSMPGQGPETYPIRGRWHPVTQQWTMEIRVQEGSSVNMWYPFPGMLQKLPAGLLYSVAPPALLKRAASGTPALNWSDSPQDKHWRDLLNLLSREAQNAKKKGSRSR